MFTLTEAVIRLRDKAPVFGKRIGGTASFAKASGEKGLGDDLPTPHCYVVPLADKAEEAEGNMVAQRVVERFATIVCVNNAPDPKSGTVSADTMIRQARHEMLSAFLGWQPDPRGGRISYERGFHLHMTQARIWHQYEWSVAYYVCRTEAVADAALDAFDESFADTAPIDKVRDVFARMRIDGCIADIEFLGTLEDEQ